MQHILFSILLILISLPSYAQTTKSGYPYQYQTSVMDCRNGPAQCITHIEDNMHCDPKPHLKFDEIAEIAEQAGLLKPVNGAWKIDYLEGNTRNGNPFPDHCVWYVTTVEDSGAADAGALVGRDSVFITETKKFWRPRHCSHGWCTPKPEEIGIAQ